MTAPWYALASYAAEGATRSALVLGDRLHDLETLAARTRISDALTARIGSVDALVRDWDAVKGELADLAAWARGESIDAIAAVPLAPFTPHRVFGAASNYIEHAEEMATKLAAKADSQPFIFLKTVDSVIGQGDTVFLPPESQRVDWEVELGVVIGRPGRRIAVEDAQDHIAGYVIVNDVSARDLTRRSDFPFSHDWFRGKSFDSFTPIGPWFVPAECIADLHALRLTLSINGEVMQDGSTSEMIFDAYEQIAYLSTLLTLKPGDVIATGTPAGVGMGRGIFLKDGDEMVATAEGIGTLSNPVRAERVAA
ncbi:2-keto-4-pentenoate hydratase/2-oxohepta-3-ene-1,7-dioic acid hydratase (catechol pathway) [Sphingomonas laterariae]|uniref:2-keto-4-pentenoate hydratase/2-oxohepta-3-ene-1,7-dioic acid hydratase (Catechol pathway) n=1 Tax=Edaphosphingomonas laterariae TaxID=861865 RepID=A0A239CXK3_9SPHN|nr:fumarylacetoacetate hydrolase family protein [Sphingomonas laterariae]SNS24274.1 2-keto-4-pentenoate hydratase/2-oxohepta-3-ene-1,7-dioic acid hydratase (catechol pathway) [Sphingomonas laterariae]